MVHVPEELIQKYAVIGPRYTSYPTAPNWNSVDVKARTKWLESEKNSQKPISIYCHIPFCRTRCFYCGCNALVTRQQSRSEEYVSYLVREINNLGKYHGGARSIRQLHFGGGTPNFLLDHEFEAILTALKTSYKFEPGAEMALEANPNSLNLERLDFLRGLGFNRISFGVQDFDTQVQKAINRVQSESRISELLSHARELGFEGINVDLIYGLPYQTIDSFQATITKVTKYKPDRLAIYNFGYLPNSMPHQRKIKPETLPDGSTKIKMLLNAIQRLTDGGYEYIGMDHFALPDDELCVAMKNRRLHRNFMGYSPKSGVDLFGVGMSAISEFGAYFSQNEKDLKKYETSILQHGTAAVKGIELSIDDQIRKWVILRLICHFYLSFAEIKERFGVEFDEYFASERDRLSGLQADGLIELKSDCIKVIDHGKILVRNICMVFDDYLNRKADTVQYSKTV